jgi:hypothetical protein
MQSHTSAKTSVNTVPRLFSRVPFEKGTTNLDLGGGRFDTVTHLLRKRGVQNVVFDPYNRSEEHNAQTLARVDEGVDTVTVSNVLNVIKEKRYRIQVLRQAADAIRETDGSVYIAVYEGDRSSKGKQTSCGWQCNRPVRSYLSEVSSVFRDVSLKNGVITARDPR